MTSKGSHMKRAHHYEMHSNTYKSFLNRACAAEGCVPRFLKLL